MDRWIKHGFGLATLALGCLGSTILIMQLTVDLISHEYKMGAGGT